VRLLRIQQYDLNVFEFDWDLTWAVFFMHPDGKVLGRYGGRDASGADSRNSLVGLRYAMEAAIHTHAARAEEPAPKARKPFLIGQVPTAKRMTGGGCIHCHQIKEILRAQDKEQGTWDRDKLWTYPLPENVGIRFEKDRENVVETIEKSSSADRIGLKPGDVVEKIHGLDVRSCADVQYAFHKAPVAGEIAVGWKRDGKLLEGKLVVAAGWKKTNITWRPSMLDLLPALTVYGDDLTAEEKQALGLGAAQLAFRQKDPVHSRAQAMGVRAGDVILGVDDEKLNLTVDGFLGYMRRNYLVGDRVILRLIRDGKRLDLPVKLSN